MARRAHSKSVFGPLTLLAAAFLLSAGCSKPANDGHRAVGPIHPSLEPMRQSENDREITGLAGADTQYLTYAGLSSIPRVDATIVNDPDFPNQTLHVSGIALDVLAKALNAPASLDLIDALCTDGYRAHFPADYIAKHRPILVLTIDGLSLANWAARTHQDDPGPYFVAYENFVPAFKVLGHADQPQSPYNLVRLNFSTTEKAFRPITPAGADPAATYVNGPPVREGFTIAKQNCLRCHSNGSTGGTKSGRSWTMLSTIARTRPTYFSSYILNPKTVDPKAQMPPNPTYDAATRDALTAYFRGFNAPAYRPATPLPGLDTTPTQPTPPASTEMPPGGATQ